MNTEPFNVRAPWVLEWYARPTNRDVGGYIGIMAQPLNGWFGDLLANELVSQPTAARTYCYESGQFYLEINAANVRWSVAVWSR